MIAFFTALTYPKTHQTWNILHISTKRWHYNWGKCVLGYNSYTLSHIHKSYIHMFPEWYRPRPFLPTVFSTNLRTISNLHFRTPPRLFHRFAPNFAHSICGLSWQKVIKRILIFQTILKLLNNNFLYILLKTRSVGYLHIGLSEWHVCTARARSSLLAALI